MSPKLICVGGLSSGCGKTSVVCLLLKLLPGWGAMKVVPSRTDDLCPRGQDCESCQPPDGPYDVAIDTDIPARPGKDTSRFIEAGASRVAFVRGLPECLPAALESAIERFSDLPGIIIESTTAMPLINGLHILVAREGLRDVKDSARAVVGLVDLLVLNQNAGDTKVGSDGEVPFASELSGKIIAICASLPPDDARNQDLVAQVRLFLDGEPVSITQSGVRAII